MNDLPLPKGARFEHLITFMSGFEADIDYTIKHKGLRIPSHVLNDTFIKMSARFYMCVLPLVVFEVKDIIHVYCTE